MVGPRISSVASRPCAVASSSPASMRRVALPGGHAAEREQAQRPVVALRAGRRRDAADVDRMADPLHLGLCERERPAVDAEHDIARDASPGAATRRRSSACTRGRAGSAAALQSGAASVTNVGTMCTSTASSRRPRLSTRRRAPLEPGAAADPRAPSRTSGSARSAEARSAPRRSQITTTSSHAARQRIDDVERLRERRMVGVERPA